MVIFMDSFWSNAIKATGSVGVVAFLIYYILEHVFSEKIVQLFGSDKLFELTILVIAALLIVLLVAVLKTKHKNQPEEPKEIMEHKIRSEGPKVTYKDNSTHNGNNNF